MAGKRDFLWATGSRNRTLGLALQHSGTAQATVRSRLALLEARAHVGSRSSSRIGKQMWSEHTARGIKGALRHPTGELLHNGSDLQNGAPLFPVCECSGGPRFYGRVLTYVHIHTSHLTEFLLLWDYSHAF